jgi:muramoyltetrapeptide carboxypeptidase LdcA involved in peptidoglycan recycling
MHFTQLTKLKPQDKVAIISPSFAAPAVWPEVFQLGLSRLKEYGLQPVLYPTTAKLNSTGEERMVDIVSAFSDKEIKAVFATLGGDDQITYIHKLPADIIINNPKPFFGFSDNSHLANFLWLQGIPSFYGGCVFTQFAMPVKIDDFTKKFLEIAMFNTGTFELEASPKHCQYSDTNWSDLKTMEHERHFVRNGGWFWDDETNATGYTWGGCLESIDEMLRSGVEIPTSEQFKNIVLVIETCEELNPSYYVHRVIRALGARGILQNIKAVLVGRPDTGIMDAGKSDEWREDYRTQQRQTILETVRQYNHICPVIQNMDFGHTYPQIPLPLGSLAEINCQEKSMKIGF